ncbi:MAG: Ig-like domain-containing protein [Oscillatoriaceae cyanobacterium Prado104]|nr:Ig-like domain-containing protein [Oscillatoriaceae cyanobacterium Prado104]
MALINSSFDGNVATGAGSGQGRGAIFVRDGGRAAATGLTFSGNRASTSDPNTFGTIRTLTIPTVNISQNSNASEPNGNGNFRVNLSNSFPVDLVVNYSIGGTATAGTDYNTLSGSVVIPAGSTVANINVGVRDDLVFDPNETVNVTLQAGRNYNLGTTRTASLTIVDNEPLVSIAAGNTPAEEGEVPGTFVVSLDRAAPAGGLVVEYAVGGTATSGDDYEALTGTVLIPQGQSTATIQLDTFDDAFIDPNETVTVTLREQPDRLNYGVNPASNTASLTITDNERIAEVSIAAVDLEIGEDGFGRFQLTLTEPAPVDGLTVNYQIAGTAANGTDYQTLTGSVFVRPGNTSAGIGISSIEDFVAEGNETVELTILSGENYTIGSVDAASLTIADNDSAGLSISPLNGTTNEAGGTATFEIALTSEPDTPITVNLTSSDIGEGTLSTSSLVFTPENWNVAQTFTVTGVDDTETDGNQSYTIQATIDRNSDDANYLNLNPVEIASINVDNDTANVLITQSGGNTSVAEGGATDSYIVALTSTPTSDVTVTLTPTEQIDLGAGAGLPVTLTFTPDNANTPQTVNVAAVDDNLVEGLHEALISQAVNSDDTDYAGIAIEDVAVNISDNDLPTVTVVPGGNASEQSAIPGVFSFSLNDAAPQGGLTVNYTVNGVAQSGTDFSPLSGSITIPEGEFGANLFVNPINDLIDENPPEALTLTLSNGTDYQIGAENAATIAISDDDIAGVRILETGNRTNVAEGGATDIYRISLTSQPTSNVTIDFITDNQLEPISSITFTPENWNIEQQVTVVATDDGIQEELHGGTIRHEITSSDSNYQGISVRNVTANIRDRVFDPLTTSQGLGTTLDRLQQILERELLSIDLPILGDVGDFAPAFIERFRNSVVNQVRSARDLTQSALEGILERAISPFFPNVQVTSNSNIDETTFQLNLGNVFQLNNVELEETLGLPALGINLDGQGAVNFNYDLDLGFGINRDLGFFVDPDNTGISSRVDLNLANNFNATGGLGFLPFNFTNDASNPTDLLLNFGFTLNDLDNLGGANDGDRLTLNELLGNFTFNNLFDANATANANLGLTGVTNLLGNPALPGLRFDLDAGWNTPLTYAGGQLTSASVPTVNLNDTGLDLGAFVSDFAVPILQQINPIIAPFRPVIQLLNTDTKLFYAISNDLGRLFDINQDGRVSLIEAALRLSGRGDVELGFFDAVVALDELTQLSTRLTPGETLFIDRGSYRLDGFNAANPNDSVLNAALTLTDNAGQPNPDLLTVASRAFLNAFSALDGLDLPILTNPKTTAELIVGRPDIALLTYDVPELELGLGFDQTFPIFTIGPVSLDVLLQGGFTAALDIDFGFDTLGLSRWRDTGFAENQAFQVLDGFFVSDRDNPDGTGEDVPELVLTATIAAGLGVDLARVVSGFLTAGIEGIANIDLVDGGELNGTDDGRIRVSEIIPRLSRPWELFDVDGTINAFLGANVRVLGQTVYEPRFATFELARFTLGSTNSFRGVGSDPYLAGSTAFFDANFNNIQDAGEPFTVTNADGTFALDVSVPIFDVNGNGAIDGNEGQLVFVGGVDTSTFVDRVTPLRSVLDATVVTPLTTLIAELVADGATVANAETRVGQAFGLPDAIDLNAFDPLAAIAGGNAAGLEVFARQAQVENLVVQLSRSISGATGVSLQTAANRTIDAIANSLTTGTNFSNPAQLNSLLTTLGVNPAIAPILGELNQRIDTIANDTTLSLNDRAIAIARVQQVAQGEVALDLQAVGLGTQTVGDAIANNTGNALSQQINAAEVGNPIDRPDLDNTVPSARPDTATTKEGLPVIINVLANDTDADGDTLEAGFVFPAENGQVAINDDGTITYTPNANFVGTDTFAYLISDGEAVAPAEVTITVDAIPRNQILGTPGRDTLIGTSGDDEITGFQSADMLIGGRGNDLFVYNSLTDAGDTISDFEVGRDRLVLTELFNSIGYTGTNALEDEYLRFVAAGRGTTIEIDPDGPAGNSAFRPLVLLNNVTVAALNNSNSITSAISAGRNLPNASANRNISIGIEGDDESAVIQTTDISTDDAEPTAIPTTNISTDDAEPTAIQTTDISTDDAESTAIQTTDILTDDVETTATQTTDISADDAETTATQTTDISADDAETTATQTADVSTDDAETTATQTTDISTDDVETTATQTTDISTDDVETTATQTTNISTDDVETTATPTTDILTDDEQPTATPTADVSTDDAETTATPTTDISTDDVETTAIPTTDISTDDVETTATPTKDILTNDPEPTAIPTKDILTNDPETTAIPTKDILTNDPETTARLTIQKQLRFPQKIS